MSDTLSFEEGYKKTSYLKYMWKYRLQPLKAWSHMRQLIANKEDTGQVFYIIRALNGCATLRDFKEFCSSKKGQARLAERRELIAYLDDHARWQALPAGTVGRAYLDFMTSQNLTAQGLADEYEQSGVLDELENMSADFIWFVNRRRDTHDLLHILTGYSRDALGEASVLAFTHGQNRGLGLIFIAWVAALEIKKKAPKGTPIFKSIREGFKIGNMAQNIVEEDILALMQEPLEVARERLGIAIPKFYHECHDRFHRAGIDPYDALEPTDTAFA